MPCPYAAALSDDEDASHLSPHDEHSHPTTSPAEVALAAARLKCPAFANRSCPFKEAGTDADSLMEVMRTVPPSHFPSSSKAVQAIVGGGNGSERGGQNGEGGGGSVFPFQLAMEHVHQVSSLLERRGQANNSTSDNKENDGRDDGFVIKGGCPFKSFHRGHPAKNDGGGGNGGKDLARSMENFSLSAIMGRMAAESIVDWDSAMDDEGGKDDDEGENEMTTEGGSAEKSNASGDDGNSKMSRGRSPSISGSLLSQALKTGTAESHTAAENVHFVNNFIQGKIDRDLYTELVNGLHHTYVALEKLLDEHAPTHFPTLHFPKQLSRREALEEDMEFWHGSDWKMKPECRTPSPAVKDYVDRMEEVGRIDPLLLLSHAYTRYLGDLSGGKVLSRIARRALNLGKGHDGLAFYHFEFVRSAKLFKDEYREALDGLVLEADQVGRLVAEANVAFALNMRVFEELDVRGGVPGARVRDVREALAYYDAEMEMQKSGSRSRSGSLANGEEAKCPFGYVGASNPHEARPARKEEAAISVDAKIARDARSGEEGRCPWPFVFLHDPAAGMRDWQTWLAFGLISCWLWWLALGLISYWFWSRLGGEEDEAVAGLEVVRDDVAAEAGRYEALSDLDWFME